MKKKTTDSVVSFARSLSIPESSVRKLVQDREKIENAVVTGSCKRWKLKTGQHEKVKEVLVDWIHQCCNAPDPTPLSGLVIQEKVREIGKKLDDEFSASNRWFLRFITRHGVIWCHIFGESAAVDDEDAQEWISKILPRYISKYAPCDVFNADECGLFFKLMPDKSYVFKGET